MIIITATGHLGADAVVRESNGRKFITFRMCSTVKRQNMEKSTWVSVVYRYSEGLLPYLKRGTGVFVSGEQDVSLYNGRNGAQIDISVNASTLQLLGGGRQEQAQATQPETIQDNRIFKDETGDDMPF